jgi:hypothetical protein
LVVAQASSLFAGQFSCGITNAEDVVVEEMANIEVEGDRHEGGVQFMQKAVRGKKVTNEEGGGKEGTAVGNIVGSVLILHG